MNKRTFTIIDEKRRLLAATTVSSIPIGPIVYEVTIKEADKRTLEQNAKMWPMLNDVSNQIEWHGHHLSPEEWKDMFTASLIGQKVVPNFDGNGFIAIGGRSSKLSKGRFSDLIELMYAFGTERGVRWSEKANNAYRSYINER